jgi:hypothetical protein
MALLLETGPAEKILVRWLSEMELALEAPDNADMLLLNGNTTHILLKMGLAEGTRTIIYGYQSGERYH